MFDLKNKTVIFSNSGLPYPIRCAAGVAAQIDMPGVPLGALGSSVYDEVKLSLETGDVFVFCSDGIFEAFDESGREFGTARAIDVIQANWQKTSKEIVGEMLAAVQLFCGDAEQSDDRTIVVVRITQ
jgi:serine phosphatase RsbU (regulator of sigma subunit)